MEEKKKWDEEKREESKKVIDWQREAIDGVKQVVQDQMDNYIAEMRKEVQTAFDDMKTQ